MKTSTINTIFRKLSDSIPKPKTELLHRNPFELLVSSDFKCAGNGCFS